MATESSRNVEICRKTTPKVLGVPDDPWELIWHKLLIATSFLG